MAFKDKIDTGGGDTVKFNKIGDSVTGVYLGAKHEPEGKFGPTNKHILKTDTGMRTVWAKPGSQLDSLLAGEEGNKLRITFANEKNSGKGNPTKIYKVAVDDDFERLAPEYLLSSGDDSEFSEETQVKATTSKLDDIRAKLAKRK